ncbi:MAG: leucine-rich repeat protein [Parasporobacterium sp.]|nr:leucine-rich repeat protein [Parasporobacterium sp.]
MNYSQYLESMKEVEPLQDYKLYMEAVMWPRRERLPLRLMSVGDIQSSVIKVPERVKNRFGRIVQVVGVSGNAFAGQENVTDIILPSSIEGLPPGAFTGCRNLKNVTIPRNIGIIREKTFEGCTSLENVFYEGTLEEWRKIEIIHEKHEIEFGDLIPGTPVHEILSERLVNIPGNEALLTANINLRCPLEGTEQQSSFQITCRGKDVTNMFRTG